MSTAPLSPKTLRDTLKFLALAAGHKANAALLAGIPVTTFQARVKQALALPGAKAPVKVDRGTLQRAAESHELEALRTEAALLREQLAARVKVPKFPKVKRRSGKDDYVRVIIPDTHSQHIDPQAFAAVLEDIKALNPDELVGLGDHLDCGGFLAQHHVIGTVAQMDEVSYSEDLACWEKQLNLLQSAAPRAKITLLEGNHEERVERWCVQQTLGNQRDAELLRRTLCPEFRLDYKGRGIDYVRHGELREGVPVRGAIRLGKCYFTHGFALGKDAARNHAIKFGAPVVYGHTHTPSTYFGRSVHGGVHAAWNFGTLAKANPRYMHNNPDNWGLGWGLQLVSRSGHFTTVHVPIIQGESYLPHILRKTE